ncbi:MAG: hypothetical protein KAT83_02535 [Candidatus Aenigmarchaeota archaeon]|nr:hypothetical protein [Candidatus Aenigmarchaeota archaeon]
MEKEVKNRIGLLSILLIAGLLMAGIGTALGAGDILEFAEKQVSASVMTQKDGSSVVTIWEDDKVVNEFILPESSEDYIINSSNSKIVIGKMTEEEMEKHQVEAETEENKVLEIAKKDSRVQKLISGKEYNVIGISTSGAVRGETETAILMLDVEGKYYEVTIDLNSETVKSVEEQTSGRIEGCYGSGCK